MEHAYLPAAMSGLGTSASPHSAQSSAPSIASQQAGRSLEIPRRRAISAQSTERHPSHTEGSVLTVRRVLGVAVMKLVMKPISHCAAYLRG